MPYHFGDVIVVPFPFTDQTTTKKRPAVVVSSEVYRRERPDLILMAITSQLRPAPTVGEAAVLRWQEAGLLKPSLIKPLVTPIETNLVLSQLGTLLGVDADPIAHRLGAGAFCGCAGLASVRTRSAPDACRPIGLRA
jgi:mRNA interferase MazF